MKDRSCMSRDSLEAIEASISTLVTENASVLAELRMLKRKRRALSAGYASGNKRRANATERDDQIRQAYHKEPKSYGIITSLAKQHKLSVRQVHRIVGTGAVQQIDRHAPGVTPPPANAVFPTDATTPKPPRVRAHRSASDPPASPHTPSRQTRAAKTKSNDDLAGHQGDLLLPPTALASRGKP